jgi:molybdopterin converting factor small subunit
VLIRTLFFATYRDLVGTETVDLDVNPGATIADVLAGLRERGGGFLSLPATPVAARNMTYAPLHTTLEDGDEVAFLPPISGG